MSRRRFMGQKMGTSEYTDFYFVATDNLFYSPSEVSKMNYEDRINLIMGYAIGRLNYSYSSTNPSYNVHNSGLGRIMSLRTVTGASWGFNGTDVPGLYNFDKYSCWADCDGKSNTAYISSQGAARLCKQYNPGYRNGEWYLPSAGEMYYLFWQNKTRIESDLRLANVYHNIAFTSPVDAYIDYWTSTECGLSKAIYLNTFYGHFEPGDKNYNMASNFTFYAIPFLII